MSTRFQVSIQPTMGLYANFVEPLDSLGFATFDGAFERGLITKRESQFLRRLLGDVIPRNEAEYREVAGLPPAGTVL